MNAKEVMVELFQRIGKGDADGARALFADDVVIHMPGRSPLAGEYEGIDGFAAFRQKWRAMTGGSVVSEQHELMGEGEHAVRLVGMTAEREGRRFSWNEAAIYHVRDGKVTEAWFALPDLYGFDEFWS